MSILCESRWISRRENEIMCRKREGERGRGREGERLYRRDRGNSRIRRRRHNKSGERKEQIMQRREEKRREEKRMTSEQSQHDEHELVVLS